MSKVYQISTFSYFNIDLWRHFLEQVCNTGHHSKACSIANAMKVTANRLLNHIGHGEPKTKFRGHKIVSENRKIIFRSKLMVISVMVRPNESKKSVVTQEQSDCCIVIIERGTLWWRFHLAKAVSFSYGMPKWKWDVSRKIDLYTCQGCLSRWIPWSFFALSSAIFILVIARCAPPLCRRGCRNNCIDYES